MHRLFVAIRPPEPIRDRLLDLADGVRGARWVEEEQLHLTLRFIGEVDRHRAEDAAAALGGVHHPAFALALSGLGSFDRRGGSSTLWAGVAPQEPLKSLHKKIDQALERVGIPPDRRVYHPHITLARIKRDAAPLQPLIDSAGSLSSDAFDVSEFRLYESELTPDGPVYTVVARYSLA